MGDAGFVKLLFFTLVKIAPGLESANDKRALMRAENTNRILLYPLNFHTFCKLEA